MIHTCFEYVKNNSNKCASKQIVNGDPYLIGWILTNATGSYYISFQLKSCSILHTTKCHSQEYIDKIVSSAVYLS